MKKKVLALFLVGLLAVSMLCPAMGAVFTNEINGDTIEFDGTITLSCGSVVYYTKQINLGTGGSSSWVYSPVYITLYRYVDVGHFDTIESMKSYCEARFSYSGTVTLNDGTVMYYRTESYGNPTSPSTGYRVFYNTLTGFDEDALFSSVDAIKTHYESSPSFQTIIAIGNGTIAPQVDIYVTDGKFYVKNVQTDLPTALDSTQGKILYICRWVFSIFTIIALAFFFMAIAKVATSNGDSRKRQTAWTTIMYSGIVLAIFGGLTAIVSLLWTFLK